MVTFNAYDYICFISFIFLTIDRNLRRTCHCFEDSYKKLEVYFDYDETCNKVYYFNNFIF